MKNFKNAQLSDTQEVLGGLSVGGFGFTVDSDGNATCGWCPGGLGIGNPVGRPVTNFPFTAAVTPLSLRAQRLADRAARIAARRNR